MDDEDPQWWPKHVQAVFVLVGGAMRQGRLSPKTLASLPTGFGSILPNHEVRLSHVRGRDFGRRKGYYQLLITGPVFAGRWQFVSGKLERLARKAAHPSRPTDRTSD